jgi:hypothetical protein
MSLDTLETLEWAINTIRDKVMFGRDELGAALARESRAKGAMLDAKKEIEKLRAALLYAYENSYDICWKDSPHEETVNGVLAKNKVKH